MADDGQDNAPAPEQPADTTADTAGDAAAEEQPSGDQADPANSDA